MRDIIPATVGGVTYKFICVAAQPNQRIGEASPTDWKIYQVLHDSPEKLGIMVRLSKILKET